MFYLISTEIYPDILFRKYLLTIDIQPDRIALVIHAKRYKLPYTVVCI